MTDLSIHNEFIDFVKSKGIMHPILVIYRSINKNALIYYVSEEDGENIIKAIWIMFEDEEYSHLENMNMIERNFGYWPTVFERSRSHPNTSFSFTVSGYSNIEFKVRRLANKTFFCKTMLEDELVFPHYIYLQVNENTSLFASIEHADVCVTNENGETYDVRHGAESISFS